MKNICKKFSILVCLVFSFLTTACTQITDDNTLNLLTDCKDDLSCAANIAGFKFPLVLSNFNVFAMEDMIEITYPLDENRDVTVRKTTLNNDNKIDLNQNHEKYQVKDILTLENGVTVTVLKNGKNIYVAYLAADSGYYSIFCPKGMSEKDIWQIYNVLAEAEAH